MTLAFEYLFYIISQSKNSFQVPQVYHSNSNDKVLIMEYMEGVAITKVKEIQEMGINLRDVSLLLNHCFSRQIFEFGHVHGDPHPGNYSMSNSEFSHTFNRKFVYYSTKRFFRQNQTSLDPLGSWTLSRTH